MRMKGAWLIRPLSAGSAWRSGSLTRGYLLVAMQILVVFYSLNRLELGTPRPGFGIPGNLFVAASILAELAGFMWCFAAARQRAEASFLEGFVAVFPSATLAALAVVLLTHILLYFGLGVLLAPRCTARQLEFLLLSDTSLLALADEWALVLARAFLIQRQLRGR